MYEQYSGFHTAAQRCGEDYYTDGSLISERLEAAYRIYRNACAGTRLADFDGNPVDFGITIVGRLALKSSDGSWISADENFPSIDAIMRENLKIMDENTEDSGTILSANLWSLLANDAWLLGGIQAHTEFHLASPLRWENLWDKRGNRMTVTAREVIGISSFGYSIIRPVPQLEAIAQCTEEIKAKSATLAAYKKAVQKCQTIEGFGEFYESIPESARQ